MASFRSHQRGIATCLVIAVLGLCMAGEAAEFAGGTGEPNDPYQIATAEQLIAIGSDPNLLDKHFVLAADIDLDPNLPGGRVFDRPVISPDVWVPGAVVFTGRFDGRGHAVSGLRIVSAGSDLGLFGVVGRAGVVQNLRLKDANVIVTKDTMGLIGTLVGFNWGVVNRCEVTGVLSGYESVGGLVGLNEGTVRECSFTGSVSGDRPVGGLIGNNEGVAVDCWCNGSVTGRDGVGGLIGSHSGALMRSYATGPVTATHNYSGGLVGSDVRVVADSYFRDATSGGGPNNGCGVPLSDAQMRQRASFAGWDFAGEPNDGSRDTWYMPEGGLPVLSWQADRSALVWLPELAGTSVDEASAVLARAGLLVGRVTYDWDPFVPAGKVITTNPAKPVPLGAMIDLLVSKGPYDWQANPGDGSETNPYQIETAGQLNCLDRRWYRRECFVLTCDIDLTAREYGGSAIASLPSGGSFDGRGHRVIGLTIISAAEYVGLFGMIEQGASVRNLVLDNAYVVGRVNPLPRCGIGALVGESNGLISCCGSANGQIIGGSEVGGLVGHNYGAIEDCYASGFVMGHLHTGGLVGFSNGAITDSYAQGRVVGYTETGGLAGGSGGAVRFCHALGPVTSEYRPMRAGGLLGSLWSADDPVSSYFLASESGGGPDNSLGTAVTDARMRDRATFVGWDFETVWSICEGRDYPRLQWEQVECK